MTRARYQVEDEFIKAMVKAYSELIVVKAHPCKNEAGLFIVKE
jgi:hypothetical protein